MKASHMVETGESNPLKTMELLKAKAHFEKDMEQFNENKYQEQEKK